MRFRLFTGRRGEYIPVPDSALALCEPSTAHLTEWIKLRRESKIFLQQWEPVWPADDLTSKGYMRRLRSYKRQRKNGSGRVYFLVNNCTNRLLGGVSLTRIKNYPHKSAVLGYWMGRPYAGHGNMSKAVPILLDHVFLKLGFMQVKAACLPYNKWSIALLMKSGFVQTGFARDHLEINGILRDHLLFTCTQSSVRDVKHQGIKNVGKSITGMV